MVQELFAGRSNFILSVYMYTVVRMAIFYMEAHCLCTVVRSLPASLYVLLIQLLYQ